MAERRDDPVCLALAALDLLMPLHLRLDGAGRIAHAGPTLCKLRSEAPFLGKDFFDVFEVRRPSSVASFAGLRAAAGAEVRLRWRGEDGPDLKGLSVPLADAEGVLLNLSFGISVIDAVRAYRLSQADFAATDLTLEMLYIVEAKSAAMAESRRLNHRLESARMVAEEKAYTDALTGLNNRRAMENVIEQLIEAQEPFALMQIDLDFFKDVNDGLGHAAGDFVLQRVAQILLDETRNRDTVVRAGGDEFILVLRNMMDEDTLRSVAARLISRLEEPISYNGWPCRISASIGVTRSDLYAPPQGAQMLNDADAALYLSKREGRARVTMVTADLLASGELGRVLGAAEQA